MDQIMSDKIILSDKLKDKMKLWITYFILRRWKDLWISRKCLSVT